MRKTAPDNIQTWRRTQFNLNSVSFCVRFNIHMKLYTTKDRFLVPLMWLRKTGWISFSFGRRKALCLGICNAFEIPFGIQYTKFTRRRQPYEVQVHCADMNFFAYIRIYRMTYWYLSDKIQGKSDWFSQRELCKMQMKDRWPRAQWLLAIGYWPLVYLVCT